MPEPPLDPDQLRKQRNAIEQLINRELARPWRLNFPIGPVSIDLRRRVNSGAIAAIYSLFNVACLVAGVCMILFGGILAELGIAIVVGSIFAFGSFFAQWWTVQAQREVDIRDHVLGGHAVFERLAEMRDSIDRLIDEQNTTNAQAGHEKRNVKKSALSRAGQFLIDIETQGVCRAGYPIWSLPIGWARSLPAQLSRPRTACQGRTVSRPLREP